MRSPKIESMNVTPLIHQGGGVSLLLGTDYERKKQKLRQELHLDYKHYLEKKKHFKTAEPSSQHQGLSLFIDERTSVKEKLKEERNKEYNLFLQERAHAKGLKRGAHLATSKVQTSDSMCRSSPDYPPPTSTNVDFPHREQPASKRDAACLTEAVDNGKSPRIGEPRHQRQSRWKLRRPKEIYYSSEEEFNTDKEEELSHSMKQNGHTQKPDYKVEKITTEHRAKRVPMDVRNVEASGVHDQNNNNWVWKSKGLQTHDGMKTPARSRPPTSKDRAMFATGLMIGAIEEQEAAQMRKENYKQELLKQIAEHEKNKRREKELELKVAATGITDPEKRPDRIKQFGAVHRNDQRRRRDVTYKPEIDEEASGNHTHPKPGTFTEGTGQRGPLRPPPPPVDYNTHVKHMTGKTRPETEAAPRVPPLDVLNEDYHRDLSDMLGEVTVQRIAGANPPVPPTVNDTYKTPYDAAYYYYGTRNPLDPSLPYSENDLPGGTQQSENFQSHSQRQPPLKPSDRTDFTVTDQHGASLLAVGELSGDRERQKRDSALRNQEELRQQIKEKEERKRKEKEEKELFDAKIEAEMKVYNPWGRSGGGAPIKDQRGNLVSDLYHMHRINEESKRNLISGDHRQRQTFVTRSGHTPGVEARAPLLSQRKPDDLPGGTQQSENFQSHSQRQPPLKPSDRTDFTVTDQHGASLLAVGELSGDRERQKRDSALRNQEELRQQIKEKEERKRKEKEEKELFDAKIEAEMKVYDPWGRSGGGASIKDLYHMHRINEESKRNLISGDHRQRQKFVTRSGHTPGVEARAPLLSQQKTGVTESDQWQPQGQDNYKEDLRLQLSQSIQIEEPRRKKVEERERIRMEEEREETRLAERSARLLQEYEEEQRKQKIEHRPDMQVWVHKHNKHHRQEERKVKREENRRRFPEVNMEKEERNEPPLVDKEKVEAHKLREPSPPIPTLQKKWTNTVASTPPSAVSRVSARTEHSVSAPHIHPVPVPKLQEGQQEVLRELSTLRRYLRKQQRQLEVELAQTEQKDALFNSHNRHTRQAKVEAAGLPQKKAVQPPTRRFNSAHVNMQNIRDFNKLKYRDTVSREEVCHMYPDPPTDPRSLDIQQQALLREQQRRLHLLRRKAEHDILDQHQGFPLPESTHQTFHYRNNARRYAQRDSILPSETAFIGVYSGDAGDDFIDEPRSHQPSAEPQERTARRRRHVYDEVPVSVDQMERDNQSDAKSLQSDTNLNLEAEFRRGQRRDSGSADHKRKSEGQGDDGVDVLSLRSTPSAPERRVSVETVATEPWLRPGTSNAVKHSGDRPRPGTRTDAPPRLIHRIT